jgi:hypothetical protein
MPIHLPCHLLLALLQVTSPLIPVYAGASGQLSQLPFAQQMLVETVVDATKSAPQLALMVRRQELC